MGEILYDLIIYPIWLLLEFVFKMAYSVCNNPGISIIFVSLVVNILVLPLYLKSDALQAEDRKKQKDMEHWIKHIRKTFKGDERFMILSEFYRQNDYQPYYVLKSSLSLLLQIPFFIAAYTFLSDLQLLHGVEFLMIKDLGLPDGVLSIGGFSINVLPILMTVINLASSVIYTKGGPLREKVQTIGMALIFLVLLYRSPSGLVFYWTLNNLFSLGKNIVMSLAAKLGWVKEKKAADEAAKIIPAGTNEKSYSTRLWLISSAFISILMGTVVPLSVITSSPIEFVKQGKFADPTSYVYTTTATCAGFFLVWGAVIFFLGTPKFRKIYSRVCLVIAATFFMNFMFFSQTFGTLFDDLVFSGLYKYSTYESFLNVLVTAQVALILVILAKKHPKAIVSAMSILVVSGLAIGVFQTVTTSAKVRSNEKYKVSTYTVTDYSPVVTLSRTGKNVVVLCMDKALGGLAPYIFDEKPELLDDFTGFTYYPNTVSFAGCTLLAIPSMYGGYEYTTWDINHRPDKPLKDEMNEALKLMPTIFGEAGFHSTVCDVPYGNFNDDGDLTIFDDVKDCETHWLTTGGYSGLLTSDEQKATDPSHQKRRFIGYSLCKVAPLIFQEDLYDNGKYNSLSPNRVTNAFANSYVIMKHLPELTQFTDDDKNQLLVMHNMMPHEGVYLDPPDYVLTSTTYDNNPAGRSVTLNGRTMHIEDEEQLIHYDSNISSYIMIAKWLRELKEQGVYDNTRIIIVADHGYKLGQFDDFIHEDMDLDVECINPLLMVKDFNEDGAFKTDDSFMTNADVPTIAMGGIIDDPVNPFTGNAVNSDRKSEGPLIVTKSSMWNLINHSECTYSTADSHWFYVHDSIFDADDWSICEE